MSLRVANFITKIEGKKEREDTNRFGNLELLQLKFQRVFKIVAKTLFVLNYVLVFLDFLIC